MNDWTFARGLSVMDVAGTLGLDLSGTKAGPCPACNATRRSRTDGRAPLNIFGTGFRGWKCQACEAGGDVLDLVAFRVEGVKFRATDGVQKDRIHGWFVAHGFASPDDDAGPLGSWGTFLTPKKAPEEPPAGPDREWVGIPTDRRIVCTTESARALWARSYRAAEVNNDDLARFLKGRGWPARELDALEVCRILPCRDEPGSWPDWWPYRGDTHRLAVRWYSAGGALRSLSARRIDGDEKPKTLAPKGASRKELLAANRLGWRVLDRHFHAEPDDPGTVPTQFPDARVDPNGWPDAIWLVEGVTDLINASLRLARAELNHAVLAGVEGSWGALLDVPWPEHCLFYVATDDDPAGEKHADKAIESLPFNVIVNRVRWGDASDAGNATEEQFLAAMQNAEWVERHDFSPMTSPLNHELATLVINADEALLETAAVSLGITTTERAQQLTERDLERLLVNHNDENAVIRALKLPPARTASGSPLERLQTVGAYGWVDDEAPAAQWLLSGVLERGETGLIAAPGNLGKTWAVLELAIAIAAGGCRDWLGAYKVPEDACGHVLVVSAEETPKHLHRRIRTLTRDLTPEQRDQLKERLHIIPGAGLGARLHLLGFEGDPHAPSTFSNELHAALMDGGPWSLVVFDPMARMAPSGTETDQTLATLMVDQLTRFTTVPGDPAVLMTHHTSQQATQAGSTSAEAIRGVTGLKDAARWTMVMQEDPNLQGPDGAPMVRVDTPKVNNAKKQIGPVYLMRDDRGPLYKATPSQIEAARQRAADAKAETKAANKERDRIANEKAKPTPRATR